MGTFAFFLFFFSFFKVLPLLQVLRILLLLFYLFIYFLVIILFYFLLLFLKRAHFMERYQSHSFQAVVIREVSASHDFLKLQLLGARHPSGCSSPGRSFTEAQTM